jgi:PTH1 family peptidyl-tRNA hydrolase
MIVIVGLGNPGTQYSKTRHNVGFVAIDEFAKQNNFADFKLDKKSNSLISSSSAKAPEDREKQDILLVKPQTFMNDSGKAVKQIIKNKPSVDLIVIHDDIDLPVGKIKIVKERGSAGHKGVESIIQNIGNENLIRFRIGIAPEKKLEAEKIVLKNFAESEQKIIKEAIEKTSEAINSFIKNGLERTMNEYNK